MKLLEAMLDEGVHKWEVLSNKSLAYSVPQGSYSGANIFTAYYSTIINVIPNGIAISCFADDHSIHKEFNPSLVDHEVQTIAKLESTLAYISSWMDVMQLKHNGNKKEYMAPAIK